MSFQPSLWNRVISGIVASVFVVMTASPSSVFADKTETLRAPAVEATIIRAEIESSIREGTPAGYVSEEIAGVRGIATEVSDMKSSSAGNNHEQAEKARANFKRAVDSVVRDIEFIQGLGGFILDVDDSLLPTTVKEDGKLTTLMDYMTGAESICDLLCAGFKIYIATENSYYEQGPRVVGPIIEILKRRRRLEAIENLVCYTSMSAAKRIFKVRGKRVKITMDREFTEPHKISEKDIATIRQTLKNLYRNWQEEIVGATARRLQALPAEEREAIMEAHGIEDLSFKTLNRLFIRLQTEEMRRKFVHASPDYMLHKSFVRGKNPGLRVYHQNFPSSNERLEAPWIEVRDQVMIAIRPAVYEDKDYPIFRETIIAALKKALGTHAGRYEINAGGTSTINMANVGVNKGLATRDIVDGRSRNYFYYIGDKYKDLSVSDGPVLGVLLEDNCLAVCRPGAEGEALRIGDDHRTTYRFLEEIFKQEGMQRLLDMIYPAGSKHRRYFQYPSKDRLLIWAEAKIRETISTEDAEDGAGDKETQDTIDYIIGIVAPKIEAYLEESVRTGDIQRRDKIELFLSTCSNMAQWLRDPAISETTKEGIRRSVSDGRWREIVYAFHSIRGFGTAGVRDFAALADEDLIELNNKGSDAIILKGPYTINDETLKRLAAAVAQDTIENHQQEAGVVIAYDSRVQGRYFAEIIARVLLSHGVKVYLFDEATPMPELSFAVTYLRAYRGILVSASHNKREYNGFKLIDQYGAQLNPKARKKVVAKLENVRYQASDRLISLGSALAEGLLLDIGEEIHQAHREHIRQFVRRKGSAIRNMARGFRICFSAFYGAGRHAVPAILMDNGFLPENLRWVTRQGEDFDALDGLFPDFQDTTNKLPDPGDPEAWRKVMSYFMANNDIDDLAARGEMPDIFIGTDPDADRCGVVSKVSSEDIPSRSVIIDHLELRGLPKATQDVLINDFLLFMGVVYVVPDDKREKYGFGGYRLLSANDAWSLMLKYQLEYDTSYAGITDKEKKFIIKSHVTTFALRAIAEEFGIDSIDTYVGMSLLADRVRQLREEGFINIGMFEESNGFTLGGAEPVPGQLVGKNGHTLEKDGTLAALLLTEIAAYARSQGFSLYEFFSRAVYLDPKAGMYATTNQPMEFSGLEGEHHKIEVVKGFEDFGERAAEAAREGTPQYIAGRPILGIRKFGCEQELPGRKGKDHKLYPGCPIEGMRFYLGRGESTFEEDFKEFTAAQEIASKAGADQFEDPIPDHITIRPSGTENKLRFYIQLKMVAVDVFNVHFSNFQANFELYKLVKEWKKTAGMFITNNDVKKASSAGITAIVEAESRDKDNIAAPVSTGCGILRSVERSLASAA